MSLSGSGPISLLFRLCTCRCIDNFSRWLFCPVPPLDGKELLNGPSLSVFGARCSSGTAERIGNISITRLCTPISQIMKMRPPVGSAVLPESSMGNPGKRPGGSGASRKGGDENFMVYRIYNRVRSIRSLSRCTLGCLILSRFYSVSPIPDEAQGGLWDESAFGGTGERQGKDIVQVLIVRGSVKGKGNYILFYAA